LTGEDKGGGEKIKGNSTINISPSPLSPPARGGDKFNKRLMEKWMNENLPKEAGVGQPPEGYFYL